MTNKTIFLTNKYNYYFEVLCPIDIAKLNDCVIHISLEAMQEHVIQETGLVNEELCDPIGVKTSDNDNSIDWCDSRGVWITEELNNKIIEEWISSFLI